MTKAEIEAERARVRQTIAWVRDVAERAEAALPPEKRRPPGASNSEWMRHILDRAQAELDRGKPAAN